MFLLPAMGLEAASSTAQSWGDAPHRADLAAELGFCPRKSPGL